MRDGLFRNHKMLKRKPVQAAPAPAPEDHLCAIDGCGEFGAWGYGPPNYGVTRRWACAAHREQVKVMR